MKKADNFDSSKWLTENKITTQSRLNEETMMIPSSLVSKIVNMKSRFGDKAGDPTIKAKLIPIITDFFPKNQDVSFQELEDKFGEETARQTIQVLNGAYLDGYLDSFQKPITNLYQDYYKKYVDNEDDLTNMNESRLNEDEDLFTYNNRGQGSGSDSKTQKGTSISINDVEPEMNVIISYGYDGGQGSGSQGTATLSGKVKSVTSDKVFISIDDAKLNKYTKKYQVMYKRDGKGISKRDITKITTL